MATLKLNGNVPEDGPFHFTFGETEFDLGVGGTYETDDATVIGIANGHPWFDVEVPQDANEDPNADKSDYDPADPQDNPAADHLSVWASDESKSEAEAAEAAIREQAYPNESQEGADQEPVAPAVDPVRPAAVTPPTGPDTKIQPKADRENN